MLREGVKFAPAPASAAVGSGVAAVDVFREVHDEAEVLQRIAVDDAAGVPDEEGGE